MNLSPSAPDESEEQTLSRRKFLEFMGRSGVGVASALTAARLLSGCASAAKSPAPVSAPVAKSWHGSLPFVPIEASWKDELVLAQGFESRLLIQWGDPLTARSKFGFNNDYLAYFPLDPKRPDDGLLWSNHEYTSEVFVSEYSPKGPPKTREQVRLEMESVGGSIVRIRKDAATRQWNVVPGDRYNRRLDATTPIPLISTRPIMGTRTAIGTFANCAGGVTPWGTLLTCEENYQDFYGEVFFTDKGREIRPTAYALGWERFYDRAPEHYGWVVEVAMRTGRAKKLCALGRFAHECATIRLASDKRPVAYMGDDANDQCVYKFISDRPGSLESGTLYVADTDAGKWLPLTLKNPKLAGKFKDQTELLIRAREAAKWAGGTPLDRPEDVEIDPTTGAVLITLTNNKPKQRYYGSILRIEEAGGDPLSLEFKASTFMTGGRESGFASPDNLAFDRRGNLWMTSDMSAAEMKPVGHYAAHGNNSLFYIPMSGPDAGRAYRVASAPKDAELTGPFFAPDGETLFLSVQHPGEGSTSLSDLTSHWPGGGASIPKPSVVTITGPAMRALLEGPEVRL